MEGVKNDDKKLPIAIVIQKQFPRALQAITQCSQFGHEKYKHVDEDWLNYQRLENAKLRYDNAMIRHFLEEGWEDTKFDKDSNLPHIYHTAWNALARLELYLKEINNEKNNK